MPVTNAIKQKYSFIKVMTGHDLSVRRIAVMEMESSQPGPAVVITACMHGDEIGGTVVVQELFRILKKTLLRGKVYAFPLLNPFGFENTSRRISLSNEDLNRSFPGSHIGTLAQRIAAIIMDKLSEWKPTIVLDLHNDWNKSIPYVLIDALHEHHRHDELKHYARISNLPAIQEAERISASFSYAVNMNDILALTLELGESLIINERNVAYGTAAIMSILIDMGMVDESMRIPQHPVPEAVRNQILTYSSNPLCSTSGIIRFSKKPGEVVHRGDRLARVYNAFGKLNETITAVHDGIILGHNDYAVAYPGSPVMAFGLFN
jgi:predicted deacylase